MEWVLVTEETPIPLDKTVIIEDKYGWMGQAYWDDEMQKWMLETFGKTGIAFNDEIIRFIIIED